MNAPDDVCDILTDFSLNRSVCVCVCEDGVRSAAG